MRSGLRALTRGFASSTKPARSPIGFLPSAARFQEHGGKRSPAAGPPPLTIFCGWLGATPKQMTKYTALWHARGCDTVTFAIGTQHVLFPSRGLELMAELTGTVRKEIEQHGPRPVIFHHMSVGGYLFGQWLRSLERDGVRPGSDDPLLACVRGQVFDSPPDMNGIAAGIGQSMGIGGVREALVNAAVSGYLAATKATAGVQYEAASAAFHANWVRAPALFYYSHADAVSRSEDCATVAGKWRAAGTDVTEVVWQDTPHIQHFRMDPERYEAELDRFLLRNDVLGRRAGADAGSPELRFDADEPKAAAAAA